MKKTGKKKAAAKKAPAKKKASARKPRIPKSTVSPGGSNGGRPPYEPTQQHREEVAMLAAFGLGEREISEFMGIARNTLRDHFGRELKHGKLQANARVATSLFRRATETGVKSGRHAVTAAIFWLKSQAGWKERVEINAGEGVTPVYLVLPDNGRDGSAKPTSE